MSDKFDDDFFQSQLKRLRTDPVGTLDTCAGVYAVLDENYAVATYRLIGILTEFVEIVGRSPARKKGLLEHSFWDGPGHRPKDGSFTLAATRFALRARRTKHRLYERARNYAAVVDYYLETDLSAKQVSAHLAECTIDGVLKIQDEKRRQAEQDAQVGSPDKGGDEAKAKAAVSTEKGAQAQRSEENDAEEEPDEQEAESDDPSDDKPAGDEAPQAEGKSEGTSRPTGGRSNNGEGSKRRSYKKGEIGFNAKSFYDTILKLSVDETITVTLRCTANKNWVELEAVTVKR